MALPRKLTRLLAGAAVLAAAAFIGGPLARGTPAANQARLLAQLDELAALLAAPDQRASDVSAWSIHQHVEHLLLVNQEMTAKIVAATPPDPVRAKTILGWIVLTTGFIPRGRGDAPESTLPLSRSPDELLALLAEVTSSAETLDLVAIDATDAVVANHQVFGGLSATDWLALMGIHDHHHLKIIADIQAAPGAAGS